MAIVGYPGFGHQRLIYRSGRALSNGPGPVLRICFVRQLLRVKVVGGISIVSPTAVSISMDMTSPNFDTDKMKYRLVDEIELFRMDQVRCFGSASLGSYCLSKL